MRLAIVLSLCLAAAGCKKHAQPTLPEPPDGQRMGGGGVSEVPGATLFHTIWRTPRRAGGILEFYTVEMQKRGARREGGAWVDDNLVHQGDFGSGGWGTVKDPSQPGVWLAAEDMPNETRVDVWEAVPNP